jgi:hypothetical protein
MNANTACTVHTGPLIQGNAFQVALVVVGESEPSRIGKRFAIQRYLAYLEGTYLLGFRSSTP